MKMQMKQDLFLETPVKSKKQELLQFIKAHHYAFTHEIIAFGLQSKHIRADRDCRDLAQEGKIRRLSKWEVTLKWGNRKEGVWEFVKE